MPLVRALPGLVLACVLGSSSAEAGEVSLFDGLPHRVAILRLLGQGREQRLWGGPTEPGSRAPGPSSPGPAG